MIYIDSATLSLNGANKPVEVYVPLWFADGNTYGTGATTAGTACVQDGTTAYAASGGSATKLYTLNANWTATTKFAFEATIQQSSSSGYTAYAALWDMTSNAVVASSQVSYNTNPVSVVRSGQFTLTPGHVYGVAVWSSSASSQANITDASLIIFP